MKNITKPRNRFYLSALLAIAFGLLLTLLFCKFVPYNMDEFIHYSNLSCLYYKFNFLNSFREACGGYDLYEPLTGLKFPIRTFAYSGSFGSLYYLPLFLIWKSPFSARFLGMIFLMADSFLISRLFKFKFRYIFIFILLFFPFSYQHLADTGPVGFQIFSVIAIYYFLTKWLEKPLIRYPLLIVLDFFLAFWLKPVFAWLVPGILVFTVAELILHRKNLVKHQNLYFAQAAFALSLLLAIFAWLFAYYDIGASVKIFPWLNLVENARVYGLKTLLNLKNIQAMRLYADLINPLEATQRAFEVFPANLLSKIYAGLFYFGLSLIFFAVLMAKKKIVLALRTLAFGTGFLLSEFFAFRTKDSWAMHHFVLGLSFLVLLYGQFIGYICEKYLRERKIHFLYLLVAALFIGSNIFYFAIFLGQRIESWDDWSKVDANKILNDPDLAKNYLYVVVDWGMYYYQALYGDKNQSVLYLEPFDKKDQLTKIISLQKQYQRKILIVYREGTGSLNSKVISQIEGLYDCKLTPTGQVWRIKLQDSLDGNICL